MQTENQNISTRDLPQIPHRNPMLWVDQVLSYGPLGGECTVHLKKDALYMSDGRIRPSSFIEFVAQAQAFIGLCSRKNSHADAKVFLIGISDGVFADPDSYAQSIWENPILHVKLGPARQMGPIAIFTGTVSTPAGQILFKGKLKAFFQ